MDFGDPRAAIIAVFTIVKDISLTLFVVACVCVAARNMCAKGTRGRYIFSSIYRPLSIAGPLCWMLRTVIDVLSDDVPTWIIVADGVFIGVTVVQYYYWRDDDDDFWTGLPRRIRNRIRATLTRRPATVPA